MSEKFTNKNPFKVPEGYFEGLHSRVQQRIREEEVPDGRREVPVRRLDRSLRFRIALAAAVVAIALLSYPLVKVFITDPAAADRDAELAILDESGFFNDTYHLAEYLETDGEELDEEEAFLDEAVEYLAMNDVEMDLIFESY